MKRKISWIYIIFLLLLSACTNKVNRLEIALQQAKDNKEELIKVLKHFEGDSLKYRAACFLIESMPYYYSYQGPLLDSVKATMVKAFNYKNQILPDELKYKWRSFDYRTQKKVYDIEIISADYLIRHINHTFQVWNSRPWAKDYSFEDFCEWVLPYRISDEPLEAWNEEYYRHFSDTVASLYKGGGMRGWINAVSDAVSAKFGYNTDFTLPHLGAKYLLHHRTGSCRERNDFLTYVMRSLGIPITIDKYYYSPSNQSSHTWNAVRDSIGRLIPVWDIYRLEKSDGRKKGKVYRLHFTRQSEKESWTDVTYEYFGHNEYRVDIADGIEEKVIYLGMFMPSGYMPVDVARREGNKAIVKDIEPEVIFQPLYMKEGMQMFAGYPFRVVENEVRYFVPDTLHRESGRLLRKYPLRAYLYNYMDRLTGARIEAANDMTFRNADILCRIDTPLVTTYNYFYPKAVRKYRYARIVAPVGKVLNLAELKYFGLDNVSEEREWNYTIVEAGRCRNDNPKESAEKIMDNDELTFYMSQDNDAHIILDFGHAVPIEKILLVPHNDDNFIRKGDTYELFYQNGINGWRSLGIQTAVTNELVFDNIPSGALLWLRDLTRGREEQVFYLRDGEQEFIGYE